MDGMSGRGWLARAEECYLEEDWPAAVRCARQAIALGEDTAEAYDLLACALYYQGELHRALAAAEEALKRDPNDPEKREKLRRIRAKLIQN